MKERGCLAEIADLLLQIAWPFLVPICLIGAFALFDFFHITQTWAQIGVVILPLLVLAFFVARKERKTRRQRREIASKTALERSEEHPLQTHK